MPQLPHPIDAMLGASIRKCRQDKGLSLRMVALECHVSDTMMMKYEKGQVRVSLSRLFDIAKVLGVQPVDLLEDVLRAAA